MRNPRDFLKPLAIGAPDPVHEIPFGPSRMIHFLDFSNEKMVAKAGDIAQKTDILLGNLEDAIPVDRKEAARGGVVGAARPGTAPRRPRSCSDTSRTRLRATARRPPGRAWCRPLRRPTWARPRCGRA